MFVCLLKLRHRDWVHVVKNQSQAVLGQTLHRAIIINTGNLDTRKQIKYKIRWWGKVTGQDK